MNALALGVLTSVVAALAIGVVVRVIGIWDRLSLWRLARGRRRSVRRRLNAHLGTSRAHPGRPLRRRQIELLGGSFRLRLRSHFESWDQSERVLDAKALLKHAAQHGERVYLVNAESGYGKSVLGMTLSCLPTSDGLTPLYVDLAGADGDEPLVEIGRILARLGGERDRRLSGRPLIVIDALNETVDPVFFCARLANHEVELRRLGAKLLFLFSFRHPSYPARLRTALLAHGFGPLRQMDLLFDPADDRDLSFFPQLARAGSGRGLSAEQITGELRAYADRCSPGSLSRGDLRAFLEWRYGGGAGALAPSPASLRFAALAGGAVKPSPALDRIAEVAFDLLSKEVTAVAYTEIDGAGETARAALRQGVEESGLGGLVHCEDRHLRFDNETVVRALGAVWIARLLDEGESPDVLRGRTAYDVCAPYLQPALRWTLDNSGADAEETLMRVSDSISRALRGRDAPYSFYATVLCSEQPGLLGARRAKLDTTLFEQMIIAIDDDRALTWRDSLETAGRSEPQPTLDPVLDQLFEVMAAYSSQAVELLLGAMRDPQPLVRSQAAYLLLDWVNNVPTPTPERDRSTLATIPSEMSGNDGNLHFRFHQVETLEALVDRCPGEGEVAAEAVARLLEIAAAHTESGAGGEVADIYAECQRLVAKRAAHLARPSPPGDFSQDLGGSVRRCMRWIDGDRGFLELGSGPAVEARLECWEVTLAFAVYSCRHLHRNAEFTSFVEAALAHPFWIVRWWAFAGLIGIIRAASEVEDRVLAARCARCAVQRLYAGVEPMGLKHRQCALVARLLAGDDGEAARAMRTALSQAAEDHLTAAGRQDLGEGYYEVMGASPDAYLEEFFRRLGEIVPSSD